MAEAKKKTLGRRPIECKIIENKAARQVTFSKRHQGMFKKASELALLCGAALAIITFSPHGNPFVFGHPSVDSVVNRYLSGEAGDRASEAAVAPAAADPILSHDEKKQQYLDAVSRLEEAKRIKIEAATRRVAAGNRQDQTWWDEELEDGMGVEELEHYVASLEDLMKKVADRVDIESCA